MGLALYRKYRSRSLKEVVGQDHVTTLLAAAIKQDKVAHAYLFTGPRGVGKTSIARILAHEINDLPYSDESVHLDIIEIDAASNNGVEDIRDLRDRVQTAPVSAKKKVYIIDEVHMLSKPAFNALLKTLEEPPEHVVFILATTDIDKVPDTIISRTQRHTFRRATETDIVKNLTRIAKHENADVDDNALLLVARHSDGSFRDSVSLFDQLLSGTDGAVTTEHVTKSLGLVSSDMIDQLISLAETGDVNGINTALNELESRGVPSRTVASQLADYLRRDLPSHPERIGLLNELLDISRSSYPELKLLTVLGLYKSPAATPQPVTKPSMISKPLTVPTPPKAKTSEVVAPEEVAILEAEAPKSSQKKTSKPHTVNSDNFDWTKLVDYVRTHHVAINSVLSKCEPEVDDGTLRLYTKSAFYKKKLDDPKYKSLLSSSLTELGYDLDIDIVATAKPLKDSDAARVAAMMGGGEEVDVDET